MGEESEVKVPYHRPLALPSDTNNRFRTQALKLLWNGQYTKGKLSDELALKVAERTGYEFAIPLGSGTAALFILARWYWKQGYRSLRVPAFTWCSTYKPFDWLGYKIRFADIDRETWLADFGNAERDANELILPVDTFGNVYPHGDYPDGRYPLPAQPTDSAQSMGAEWSRSFLPNRVVSLSGSKIITSGEGGILLTQDRDLHEFAWQCGWFSRLPEMSAALGLAYFQHIDDVLAKKRDIANAYRKKLPNLQWQSIPVSTNNYIVAALVDAPREWQRANPDMEFRFYYDSIVNEQDELVPFEATQASNDLRLPNTEYVSRHIIAFPSWPDMDLSVIEKMVEP